MALAADCGTVGHEQQKRGSAHQCFLLRLPCDAAACRGGRRRSPDGTGGGSRPACPATRRPRRWLGELVGRGPRLSQPWPALPGDWHTFPAGSGSAAEQLARARSYVRSCVPRCGRLPETEPASRRRSHILSACCRRIAPAALPRPCPAHTDRNSSLVVHLVLFCKSFQCLSMARPR
jgi:hypothetical protein